MMGLRLGVPFQSTWTHAVKSLSAPITQTNIDSVLTGTENKPVQHLMRHNA